MRTRPFLILIGGPSGSGKSVLAERIAFELNDYSLISLDSYYVSQAHLIPEERATRNYDHPNSLDWPLIEKHLSTLLSGEGIDAPIYRFDEHTRADRAVRIAAQPHVIVEGLLALSRLEIRQLADLKIFVTTKAETCLRRRIERDIVERGRTTESVIEQYNSTVWPMACGHVLPTQQYADLVVSGEESLKHSVTTVMRHVEQLSQLRRGDVRNR